ncbi:hypothetical protein F4Z99_09365 [Candidatus Poribacteria bacterium]|nr:hypothetical protein [Candidatus Poribacteria bacterium]MYB01676.1 hypothetical protein [Candidatus Poribacteria bacterium]
MSIPKIAADTDPRWVRHLKTQSEKMEGKTVKKVSCGIREHNTKNHQSDVLKLEFTDGSILYIQTGSNAENISEDVNSGRKSKIQVPEFHVDLWLTWADPKSDE